MLAFALLDLPGGSEVITSPLTFSTDIGSLYHLGLTPVFVDVEADTFNADVYPDRRDDHRQAPGPILAQPGRQRS